MSNTTTLPDFISTNLVEVVQGRYLQQDGSWYEQAGANSYTHHKLCECGTELTMVDGKWEKCDWYGHPDGW